ncbi:MAG: hypothetical protein K2X37_11460 [Chitinophagaceae bacterium]|nr:hypothetical protein [Chitinophagaceae bacterium]
MGSLHQVIAAKKYNFNEILTSAQSGYDFKGYYTWGRLGYTMSQSDQQKFEIWCFENKLEPSTLSNILKDDVARAKWIKTGFTWLGAFNLVGESENIKILKEYLEMKGRLGNFTKLF